MNRINIFPAFLGIKKAGFTLVELMIVMSIIGILAAVLFPSITTYLARARDTTRIQDMNRIGMTLIQYAADRWYLPKTTSYWAVDEWVWDISAQPVANPDFLKFLISDGYMTKVPLDPVNNAKTGCAGLGWGNASCNGLGYVYYCYSSGGVVWSWIAEYDQYVLGARLERGPTQTGTYQNGTIWWADWRMYYHAKHSDWFPNATSCR